MGMRFITRSNQRVTPARVMSAALTMKAPTASPMLNPPARPAVASTAAPGVDHATMTGLRKMSEGTREHRPIPSPSAHIQEVICAGVAPNACAAWNTMATELVNPTSTATNPAVNADRLRSLKNCMGAILSPQPTVQTQGAPACRATNGDAMAMQWLCSRRVFCYIFNSCLHNTGERQWPKKL